MATHSSIPAWKIPWTEEPGGLQSIGSQRVGHDSDQAHRHMNSNIYDNWHPHSIWGYSKHFHRQHVRELMLWGVTQQDGCWFNCYWVPTVYIAPRETLVKEKQMAQGHCKDSSFLKCWSGWVHPLFACSPGCLKKWRRWAKDHKEKM